MARFSQWMTVSAGVAASLIAFSCNPSGGVEQIAETRTLVTPKEAPKEEVSSAERFGMTGGGAMASATQPGFTWTTPEGWDELPSKQFRNINLRPAGDPKAECYVSTARGSLAENINRWRSQMALEPVDEAAISALPKKPLLGGQAAYVELDGNFKGMGGDQDNPDFRMVGLVLERVGGESVFVKMTGPKAIVEQEMAKFDAFCASIAPGASDPHAGMVASASSSDLPEGHPPIGAAAQGAAGSSSGNLPNDHPPIGASVPGSGAPVAAGTMLSWTAPEGWTQSAPRAMREVTFTAGANGESECYVAKLSNRGGGVEANLNRWAGQMGLDALTAEAIAALPKIKVLGNDCSVVEFKGTYTDMQGAPHADFLMLGTIAEVGTDAYFIKMVGPAADMEAQRANFAAFCESLKL
ncbi:MAG: hypothetical protein HUU46_23680 [Candidatus Hydrogenedentes bacterium]|nr:hypothetical protein [Candidatus Hydrogenedentota bacterium]